MTKFNVRTDTSQNTVLVDPGNYTHTLSIESRPSATKNGTARIDNMRYTITCAENVAVKAYPSCDKACGTPRKESVKLQFVVALGQDAGYYQAKRRDLLELIDVAQKAADALKPNGLLVTGASLGREFDVKPLA